MKSHNAWYICIAQKRRTKLHGIRSLYLIIFFTVLLTGGCSTISLHITSSPSGATIYAGPSPTQLKPTTIKTPYSYSFTHILPSFTPWYYQVKRQDYFDSEIVLMPETYSDRVVHFDLKPLPYGYKNWFKEDELTVIKKVLNKSDEIQLSDKEEEELLQNTLQRTRMFLSLYRAIAYSDPNNESPFIPHAEELINQIENYRYKVLLVISDISKHNQFIKNFPNSRYRSEIERRVQILERIEQILQDKIQQIPKGAKFSDFCKIWGIPDGEEGFTIFDSYPFKVEPHVLYYWHVVTESPFYGYLWVHRDYVSSSGGIRNRTVLSDNISNYDYDIRIQNNSEK